MRPARSGKARAPSDTPPDRSATAKNPPRAQVPERPALRPAAHGPSRREAAGAFDRQRPARPRHPACPAKRTSERATSRICPSCAINAGAGVEQRARCSPALPPRRKRRSAARRHPPAAENCPASARVPASRPAPITVQPTCTAIRWRELPARLCLAPRQAAASAVCSAISPVAGSRSKLHPALQHPWAWAAWASAPAPPEKPPTATEFPPPRTEAPGECCAGVCGRMRRSRNQRFRPLRTAVPTRSKSRKAFRQAVPWLS